MTGPPTLKRILHDHWDEFAVEHPNLRPSIPEEVGKVLDAAIH